MIIHPIPLTGAAEIEASPLQDHRGWFARWFCQEELAPLLNGRKIVQMNSSATLKAGVVRGLHHQSPPAMEDKIVRCISGRIFDVMVDLRHGSPTLGQWHSIVLDAVKQNMVFIPRGFSHGFQTLVESCQLLYLHTEYHSPDNEAGFYYNSPCLGINWPLTVTELSDRDNNLPILNPDYEGIDA